MMTFDYEAAWHEVAKPKYQTLPQNLRDLLARVAEEAGSLRQLKNLEMPWPEGSDLRERFDKIPSEWLAEAARVIHSAGHWYPSTGELDLPGRQQGSCWKFSNYADQSLRARLGISNRDNPIGLSLSVIEGVIRVCYSSRDAWTWYEAAPATQDSLQRIREHVLPPIFAAISAAPERQRDDAAYTAIRAAEQARTWPEPWAALMDTARFMVDEDEIERRADKYRTPEDIAARHAAGRRRILQHCDNIIRKAQAERDGMIWLFDHGWPVDNVIYYSHVPEFCFGWRHKLSAETVSALLDIISEFPFPYRIKCAEGRELTGGHS